MMMDTLNDAGSSWRINLGILTGQCHPRSHFILMSPSDYRCTQMHRSSTGTGLPSPPAPACSLTQLTALSMRCLNSLHGGPAAWGSVGDNATVLQRRCKRNTRMKMRLWVLCSSTLQLTSPACWFKRFHFYELITASLSSPSLPSLPVGASDWGCGQEAFLGQARSSRSEDFAKVWNSASHSAPLWCWHGEYQEIPLGLRWCW